MAALVFSVAVAAALGETGVGNWWARSAAAAGAAVATLLADQISGALRRREKFSGEVEQDVFTLRGSPPRVSTITDPVTIGVHPAGHGNERVPPYVPRDIDAELRRALATSVFVVLVGDATAGKTRTAFEAMRAVLPRHLLIIPTERQGVAAAVGLACHTRECVLWLDDLEHYLTPASGLTRKDIAEILNGTGHHRVVLATLRATAATRLTTSAQGSGGQLIRTATTVLDQAHHRIFVQRFFNDAELTRARELADREPRVAEAVRYADRYGIGEYLSGGPRLYDEWEDAWAPGNHPRGAALIAAAIDCRRAGFASPLPKTLLEELYDAYLDQHGGKRLNPEPPAAAWEWVLMPRDSGMAPLWSADGDRYEIFDYFVENLERRSADPKPWDSARSVPDATARAALRYAGSADADGIAAAARRLGRSALAEDAIRQAYAMAIRDAGLADLVTIGYRNNLGVALHNQGRLAEAEAEFRAVLESRTMMLGADHPDTLASLTNLTLTLYEQRKLADRDAAEEFSAIRDQLARELDPDHPETLEVRNLLAISLQRQGRYAEAELEHRAIVAARTVALGGDHPTTLISRNNRAIALEQLGMLAEAEAEHRGILKARLRVLGANHQHTLISQGNLQRVIRKRLKG